MAHYVPTLNVSDYELRNLTSSYLSAEQLEALTETTNRVNGQLDFVAQMLGWNGNNYWTNLVSTVDQKRKLLGGTFGLYNSVILPQVYEYRNWDNTILIERIPVIASGKAEYEERVLVGDKVYPILSVTESEDKYVLSIGELTDEFFALIANNEAFRIDIPVARTSPVNRENVGASGDSSFICGVVGTGLVLYPQHDSEKRFPYKFTVLFGGSLYYFDQPVYLATTSDLKPFIKPEYDSNKSLWYLKIPEGVLESPGLTAWLVLANSNSVESSNYSLQVKIETWFDPSDWKSTNVLNNFVGTWGNKGGALPFNYVFDSLDIHGYDESESLFLDTVERDLNFNDIVNYVYSQKVNVSEISPGGAKAGDLWWNDSTGQLSVWLENEGCGSWVSIDYRQQPRQSSPVELTFADVTAYRTGIATLGVGTIVKITDATGLAPSDNIIGLQSTLLSACTVVTHKTSGNVYWELDEVSFATAGDFAQDALSLPYKVATKIRNSDGLSSNSSNYQIPNLPITISGDYEVLLLKYYNNTHWEIYPDSILKFIANSALFSSPQEGETWWDFTQTNPDVRAASMYYENAWAGINQHPPSGPISSALDMATILFYCDGKHVPTGTSYTTNDYSIRFEIDAVNGKYKATYEPRTFVGKVQLPTVTISDSITTTYRADISNLVFSGLQYYMSPNVYNAESTLRVWKAQELQVTSSDTDSSYYYNPLRADVNTGPGQDNWSRYYLRLPLEYGRNSDNWQKVNLVCQDFGYWGSSIFKEKMDCPSEREVPAIYEELFAYGAPVQDYTYVYAEPYLYSNLVYQANQENENYQNSGVLPTIDLPEDGFDEAYFESYDPLHSRQADLTSDPGNGYGDWVGQYVNVNPCVPLTGFLETDLLNNGVDPVAAPIWDASIYKYPPTCDNEPRSYDVDSNRYKVSYAYFVADASAAEDPFFDVSAESSWRKPITQPQTSYITPR